MRRSLIRQGNSSVTVSLPSKWVGAHNLKAGDEVEITETGGALLVSKENFRGSHSIKVDITGLDRGTIMLLIQGLYRTGYDTIIVTTTDATTRYHFEGRDMTVASVVDGAVATLVGVELIQSSKSMFTIQAIAGDMKESFDIVLRRIFRLLKEFLDLFLARYTDGDTTLLDDLQAKHLHVKRFINYGIRILNKHGHEQPEKTMLYHAILMSLHKADEILKNHIGPRDKPLRPGKVAVSMLAEVVDGYDAFYKMFYDYNIKAAADVARRRDAYKRKLFYPKTNLGKDDMLLLSGMQQFYDVLLDLVELRMAL